MTRPTQRPASNSTARKRRDAQGREATPDVAGLRALLDAATGAPWVAMEYDDHPGDEGVALLGAAETVMGQHMIGYFHVLSREEQEANAALTVAAVNALPVLLDMAGRLERTEAERDRLRGTLATVRAEHQRTREALATAEASAEQARGDADARFAESDHKAAMYYRRWRDAGRESTHLADLLSKAEARLAAVHALADEWRVSGLEIEADQLDAALATEAGERAAVIDAAHLAHQREWSRETFGPGDRLHGVLDHIRKELGEIEADPTDVEEWVDVIILAFDGAWRAGWEPQQIIDAIKSKQAKNEARGWPDWRTQSQDKAIEHVAEAGERDE